MAEENVEQPLDENPASQRHWLYGFNAGVLVVVGLAVLIFILSICNLDKVKNATKFDWTSNGANSLSSGSRKMLQEVSKSGQKYTIWSLFVDASDEQKRDDPTAAAEQTRRREQVKDLLDQYTRASGNIVVEDRGDASRDDIERQIRDKYQDDFKPYTEAVNGYTAIVGDLSKFLTTEAAAIGANGQKPGTPADEREAAAAIQAQFAEAPSELQQDQKMIQRETDSILPDWGMLTSRISGTVGGLEPLFDVLSDPKKLKEEGFPPTLTTYFTANAASYKKMDDELKAYKDKLDKLQPLKVQDVLSSLGRNSVVIMGDKSAKVITESDVYKQSAASAQGTSQGLEFLGEQAISSSLYAMAKPDKVKVVFVTPTPMHLLDDMYSDMKGVLQDSNFEVLEWSPTADQQQGAPPQPSSPPPAIGKGVVWVVFTPDAPDMQAMMMGAPPPDAGPVVAATRDHMNQGGQVLFMADAGGGMMGPAAFAYADLLKDFGIEVESKYTVLHMREQENQDTGQTTSAPFPYLGLDQPLDFAKHEITTPLNGEPTIFGPISSNQGPSAYATSVNVLSPLPTGVSAMVLIKTPYGPDYWGETEMGPDAKYNKGVDEDSPVPLMAVSSKTEKLPDGTPHEARVAVIGAKMLGSNFFLDVTAPVTVGNVQYGVQQFPGNEDLMKNTILWLAGYENMIAVSSKASAAGRIGTVTPNQLLGVRLSVLLLFPILALVVGGIVWSARRR